ncbi:hypothetical protein BpHYR1_051616 [Brachionus plicatilis]|uniref:Uncharacterized protein n=1 Tax=Brachionus plicatilis TaxID=10195 RepID=A0A3M7R0A0_BRAPC|nr:hypothetical protein BpHYR1_051616 [Brachionus plicatilis]
MRRRVDKESSAWGIYESERLPPKVSLFTFWKCLSLSTLLNTNILLDEAFDSLLDCFLFDFRSSFFSLISCIYELSLPVPMLFRTNSCLESSS